MRLVVIADVHANLPALTSVLQQIGPLQPERVLCLGDSVSYNANPNECLSVLRELCHVTVAGNHDRDLVFDAPVVGTSGAARQSQAWTRRVLTPDNLAWLARLPDIWVEPNEFVAVHGAFLSHAHVSGYVTRVMLEANLRTIAGHPDWPRLGFCAHTHQPMIGVLQHDGRVLREHLDRSVSWSADAAAVIINPGSVGQPRDGDPRASFALVDTCERTARVLRVAYDVQAAMRAFEGTGLPPAHATRLLQGI